MRDRLPEESLDKMPPLANHRFNDQDDEIDLKELIVALWQGKFTIIISTVICAALAVYYALSVEEKWTAEAIIAKPEVSDISSYQRMINDFQPIFDLYQDDGTFLLSNKLDYLTSSETLLDTFATQFGLRANKKEFLSTYPTFKEEQDLLLSDVKDVDLERAQAVLYSNWYNRLTVIPNKDLSYTLNGIQRDSESSYLLLESYMNYIEMKSRDVLFSNFKAVIENKRSELIQQNALFISQAKSRLKNEILQAGYALKIADAAGVDVPQQNLSSSENELFIINIGANALRAKVNVLNQVTELSVIDPRLQQVESKLSLLNILKVDSSIDFDLYKFIEPLEEPLTRTAPKRSLIAVLGVLLGGMLGCGIVLVQFVFRDKETV